MSEMKQNEMRCIFGWAQEMSIGAFKSFSFCDVCACVCLFSVHFAAKVHGNLSISLLVLSSKTVQSIAFLCSSTENMAIKWETQRACIQSSQTKPRSIQNYLCLLGRVGIKVKVTPNAFIRATLSTVFFFTPNTRRNAIWAMDTKWSHLESQQTLNFFQFRAISRLTS